MLLGELGVAHGTADVSVLRVDDLCVKDPVSEAHHPVLIGAQTQLVISEIIITFLFITQFGTHLWTSLFLIGQPVVARYSWLARLTITLLVLGGWFNLHC